MNASTNLLVWDLDSDPPTPCDQTLVFWRRYDVGDGSSNISIPLEVERHADDLRRRYLAWVHDVGTCIVGGKRVIDWLAIRPGLSYWWLSSVAQKFNASGKAGVDDAIKTLAFEAFADGRQCVSSITLVSANVALSQVLRGYCAAKGIAFAWQRPEARRSERRSLLPPLMSAVLYLGWYMLASLRLPSAGRAPSGCHAAKVTFIDILAHLNPCAAAEGRFASNYWTALTGKLREWGIAAHWLHVYYRSSLSPSLRAAQSLMRAFCRNSAVMQQYHSLLERRIGPRALIKAVRDYAQLRRTYARLEGVGRGRPPGSILNLWALHSSDWRESLCGKEALQNCLRLALFEAAFRDMPRQQLGVYIMENQAWEMALIAAWRSAGHGVLVGVPHSTVRFWDLRYHFDHRTHVDVQDFRGLPSPDIVAVNGPVARQSLVAGGYPVERLVDVEALRFLHLLNHAALPMQRGCEPLRVLVCGDFLVSTTRRLLSWIGVASRALTGRVVFVFKPHPAVRMAASNYPATDMSVSTGPLADLLAGCSAVFASNSTSAAVDAYCWGIPVLQMREGGFLDMSPLRGLPGVIFIDRPEQLAEALVRVEECSLRVDAPYFNLQSDLAGWEQLLSRYIACETASKGTATVRGATS